jgi:cysteine-S-conjugate beta-lyase
VQEVKRHYTFAMENPSQNHGHAPAPSPSPTSDHENGAPFDAQATRLIHAGRTPMRYHGAVNMPVIRASTILSADCADWEQKKIDRKAGKVGVYYGLEGTPTKLALEATLAELEGGAFAQVYPSGLAACTIPLLAFLGAGDHALVTDSVYGPTRRFCDGPLRRLGVETTYYDPHIGAGIASLLKPNTRLVFVESPGSLTFEMQDIPAIAEVAHARGAVVMMDNTWATPLYFKPFAHGVDVSIQATTKYLAGHSDIIMGSVTCTAAHADALRAVTGDFGQTASPDDCYLVARGIRTLALRLKQHEANALELAHWLQTQPEVARVLHPALPTDPGHALWKRDFQGACGLFGVLFKDAVPYAAMEKLIDSLTLFGIGASWGGFESLVIPVQPAELKRIRPASAPPGAGPVMRLHAGLEDTRDLIADLQVGFAALRARY